MLNNVNTNVEHITAKIDNDFNVDQSDWIPRVPAWVIDAMSQLSVLRKVRKKVKLIVHDRIAFSHCPINSPDLKITDRTGCPIDKMKSACTSSTGEIELTPQTVTISNNECHNNAPDMSMAMTANGVNDTGRYAIHDYEYSSHPKRKNYVLIDNNKLELNFDADYIYAETEVVETEYSEVYNIDLPVIPNVGLLIEAIGQYCLYKMLCRGYKHPVFNLAASQYGTNPYYEWKQLKGEAKRAVIIDAQGDILVNDGNLFQAGFFVTTFK